ncbi:MAG: kynureninase, partial [Chthonomonadaceae bacterium]|nr:kynureninase [Chthonomonadaceae bacterium]
LPGSTFANPCESERRGGQVCLRYPEAKQLSLALRQKRVIGDFRPPDILRLAPAPLYVSFADCVEAVSHLLDLIETGKHRDIEETSLVS